MEHLPTSSAETLQRTIGSYSSGISGPALVGIGAIHGNEPSGVVALNSILSHLAESNLPLVGSFAGLVGNLSAFKAGQRFIHRDLNRMWVQNGVENPAWRTAQREVEEDEMQALHASIESFAAKKGKHETYVIDLHTTSSRSRPFLIMDASPANNGLAAHFPIPKVFGMDKFIPGTLSAHLARNGYTALNFEAGHHDDPQAPMKHEAMLWLALVATGILEKHQVPGFDSQVSILTGVDTLDARSYEIVYRHPVAPESHFRMLPGFDNFVPVHAGQPLAQANGQMVEAPFDAHIFMPLYQMQGSDGFFLVRETGI